MPVPPRTLQIRGPSHPDTNVYVLEHALPIAIFSGPLAPRDARAFIDRIENPPLSDSPTLSSAISTFTRDTFLAGWNSHHSGIYPASDAYRLYSQTNPAICLDAWLRSIILNSKE